ncbi:EAL domain-containing protein [Imhoffiella purpurea]|uniref:EAL domain-containing protein n=1 Tax=Imhoffiella purpurea TaxID=1249627 RepID=UPI0022B68FAA|nr:EAL domain-containing protein [Imhoffiella purpurea]
MFRNAREGILVTNAEGLVIDMNDAFGLISGYSREDILGRSLFSPASGTLGSVSIPDVWRDLVDKDHWHGEIWNRHADGRFFPGTAIIDAVRDPQGVRRHFVGLFFELSGHEEHRRHLEYVAHYDLLTGLPNRVLLAERLQRAMLEVKRRGRRLTVAYLDLDGFKSINDLYGHDVGDRLLITLAQRMPQALREGDTIARLGGDEFVAVLLDTDEDAVCEPILRRLLTAASDSVLAGELILQVSVSIGITHYPQAHEVNADQLLRQSDQAMYQAKLAGRNGYQLFDSDQAHSQKDRHECLVRLRAGLERNELVLHYQPKVNMRSGVVVGAEALIRWQHPERGLLSPAAFLPALEGHALAVEVGEWVIRSALRQLRVWRSAGLEIPVSVNVGAHQLQQTDFMDRLSMLLSAHPDVPPGLLELEVVESSALQDTEQVSRIMHECAGIGVRFSLDDFGTGYSSLTYLKRLPVSSLKIDQTFVRDMLDDPDDLSILEGVLGLARAFEREVIAEGVETVEHGRLLRQLGCELAQGFGISAAMPGGELPAWVAAWRPPTLWASESRMERDDLPLIFAHVEHRAWLRKLEGVVRFDRTSPPPLDGRHCRFGRWLHGEGRARYGGLESFDVLSARHHWIHARAVEMLELKYQARDEEALALLDELMVARESFLEQLLSLARVPRVSGPRPLGRLPDRP